ncbi:hypothetical protein Acr_17g0009340 [Actinidia rufa]|uniref:SAWADEE domain-containing protein n=1 Tax=Actinidia rufa TaxID=165716 RepID=A0A7J0G3M1_9ERIC|nr:hypothetical protein Acr_17g0009340 [Actinidia rufa]
MGFFGAYLAQQRKEMKWVRVPTRNLCWYNGPPPPHHHERSRSCPLIYLCTTWSSYRQRTTRGTPSESSSKNDALVVKLLNFAESADERFRPGDFESAEAVDEFVRRFRPISQQLQDRECSRVVEGMAVCASFAFLDDDIRFYDAVVESVSLRGKVHYVDHSFAKEEEVCLCTFVLFWKHGPNEGNVTSAGIANNRSIVDELKVAHRGTKEYWTAKSRKDLFMDFIEHQHRLHKRLALEEKKILQLSAAD